MTGSLVSPLPYELLATYAPPSQAYMYPVMVKCILYMWYNMNIILHYCRVEYTFTFTEDYPGA